MNKLGLKKGYSANEIKKIKFNHFVWEKNAKDFKTSHEVSWGDKNMVELEIKNVARYLKSGNLVLDAGCSNGYSTLEIATKKNVKIKAFDYSKESIINAIKSKQKAKDSKVEFYHGNILEIPEQDQVFDKVFTIRVVINLLTWSLQKRAIQEIHRVLKPGGYYLASEAFFGGMKNINALRKLAGMPPLKELEFNLYLREKRFEKYIKKHFEIVEIRKFSSIYYAASRFLRYLTLKKDERDSYINEINNFFVKFEETENSGDFGIQKLYVLKKI